MVGHPWCQKMVPEDTVPRHILFSAEMKKILCTRGPARVVRRALAVACWSFVLAMLVSSCSSSPTSAPEGTTVLKPGALVPFDLAHNARADVHASACHIASGSWLLQGTVRNPGTTATGFQIVVDFVSAKGDTVISTTEIDVPTVAPKASADWSATGAKGKPDVACLVRQAQTT